MDSWPKYSNITISSLNVFPVYVDFTVEGGILTCLNLYLALAILFTKRLRSQKEYIVIASNIIFDAAFGLAYCLSGIRFFVFIYSEEYMPLLSKWQCFTNLHIIIFTIITPGVGLISFFTCINSLISVVFPVKYWKLDAKFAYLIPMASFLCTIPTFILAGITSYEDKDVYMQPALCNLQNSGSTQVYQSLRAIRIACSVASVPLYIPIAYKMYQLIKKSYQYSGLSSQQRKKLINMTLTLMLITLSELVLFGIPDFYLMLHPNNSNFTFNIMNINKGIINIVIFLRTQKELRSAIVQVIFQCCLKQKANIKTAMNVITSGTHARTKTKVKTNTKKLIEIILNK